MTSNPTSSPRSRFRNPFFYSGVVILFVAAFVFYTMLERYLSKRAFEDRAARQQAAKQLAEDRAAIQQLGGSELAIRGLYLSPSLIHPGQSAQLCYDVANAKTVVLDPPVAEVWPSHSRCIAIQPRKPTTFTLTIADATGKTISQSVELQVQ